MCDLDVDLGFAEPEQAAWLVNRYFPSKLGGKPAWLELEELPTKEQLQCKKCLHTKSFVCQLYAPFEDDFNFHRSLFVFICRSADCQVENSSENVTVLRSQLSRKNEFYSEEAPDEDDADPLPEIRGHRKLCEACGCPGPAVCGRCKNINYCSAAHQRAHWPLHKKVCGSETNAAVTAESLPNILFPECEIVMESDAADNPEENDNDENEEKEKVRQTEYEKFTETAKTCSLQDVPDAELDQYTSATDAIDDKYFSYFKKQTLEHPSQIVRYKRGGQPLWITDIKGAIANQLETLPNCEKCGSERHFEFQIMPQMILTLKDDIIDWGVLVVYTCKRSCEIKGYVEEYVIKQDIQLSDEE